MPVNRFIFLIVFLSQLCPLSGQPGLTLRQTADSLYAAEQYDLAAERYEALAASQPSAENLLRLARSHYEWGDYRSARRWFEEARQLSLRTASDSLTAEAALGLGTVLSRLSYYKEAEYMLEEALSRWRALPGKPDAGIAACLDALGMLYQDTYRLDESEPLLEEALAMRRQTLGDKHLETALSYHHLGTLALRRGQYNVARDFYEQCLAIRQEQLPPDHFSIGRVYHNLAIVFNSEGRNAEALELEKKVLAIYKQCRPAHSAVGDAHLSLGQQHKEQGNYQTAQVHFLAALESYRRVYGERQQRVGTIYNVLADLHRLRGDFEQALQYAERGLEITRSVVGPEHDRVATGLTTLGDIAADAGDTPRAIAAYQEAIRIRRKVLGGDHPRTAFLYFLLGQIQREAGQGEQAVRSLHRALAIHQARGGQNKPDIADIASGLGLAYLQLGNQEQARRFFRLDLKLLHELYGQVHPYLADSYKNMAQWHLSREQLDSALICYHEAFQAMNPDFDNPDLYALPPLQSLLSPYEFLPMLKAKAEIFERRASGKADFRAALALYQHAARLIDRLQIQYRSHNAKLFFQRQATPIYVRGLSVAYRLYENEGKEEYLNAAFRLAEQTKAALLTSTLQELETRSLSGVPEPLRQQAQKLRGQLAGTEQRLFDERLYPTDSSGVRLRQLQGTLVRQQTSYDSLLAVIKAQYPEYYQLTYGREIIELPALKEQLDPETLLLEYVLADSLIYSFSIRRETVRLTRHPWDSTWTEAITTLRRPPEREAWLTEPEVLTRQYQASSHLLYQKLIRKALGPETTFNRLVIVPHGELAYLPFEGLVEKQGATFLQARYLFQQAPIQYANSATLWAIRREELPSGRRQLLGVAPEYSNSKPVEQIAGAELNFREALGPLRYNVEEVRRAADHFSGQLLTGEGATERAFKKEAGRARILHLAMHAVVSDSLPAVSSLYFAPNQDTLEDGVLHAYELYNLSLPAELAILSACNTGFGHLQDGEGVLSLAHAFQYAGCRSVVMSLWPAEDEGTANLISDFYEALAAGLPKDKALQEARQRYLARVDPGRAHPYYWTHLVAVGDMSPLRRPARWLWWVAGSLILGLLVFIFKK